MNKIFLLISIIMLTGCDPMTKERASFVAPSLEPWETAPTDHVCTVAQMTKAQNEAGWCIEHTQWRSIHCYGASIIRNCTKKVNNENI